MAFNSLSFLIFFPIAVVGYYLVPHKAKNLWLLVLSYYFYMNWNATYALLIFFSTLSTYLCAGWMGRLKSDGGRKAALCVNIAVNLSILFLFKYYDMFTQLLVDALGLVGVAFEPMRLSLLLPVGISFYTFQALGYSIDVYRGTVEHEKSFLNYALFVSFFPQLVAGPIERSENLLPQFRAQHPFRYENLAVGLRIMLLGFLKKVVIADNIGIAVDRMYTYLDVFPGPVLLFGVVLFAVQVYCDFGGYSDIALGAAKVLGFDLMRNFDHPYFSETIAEFWRRWHISLGGWFRDYLFYPVLRSNFCMQLMRRLNKQRRKKLARILPTAIALMVVWCTTGLWHGAAWTYVAWGTLHGVYQIVGNIIQPYRKQWAKKTGWDKFPRLAKAVRIGTTFALVCVGYVFFRSATFGQAWYILTHWFRGWGIFANPVGAVQAFVSLANSVRVTVIILVSIAALWLLELYERRRGLRFEQIVAELRLPVQWCIYYAMLLAIALFGAFGQSSFIYFQF